MLFLWDSQQPCITANLRVPCLRDSDCLLNGIFTSLVNTSLVARADWTELQWSVRQSVELHCYKHSGTGLNKLNFTNKTFHLLVQRKRY